MNNLLIDYGLAVVRRPARPFEELEGALANDVSMKRTIESEWFKSAILHASPDLYDEFIKYLDGRLSDKDAQRMAISAYKYLSRMCTRPTPFASFSYCAVLNLKCNTPSVENMRSVFRFDMGLLHGIIKKYIAGDKQHFDHLIYRINPTIFKCGKSYRYMVQSADGKLYYRMVESTPLLHLVIRHVPGRFGFSDFRMMMHEQFDISDEDIRTYLQRLLSEQIVICTISNRVIGDDLFHSIRCIADASDNKPFRSLCSDFSQIISRINGADSASTLAEIYADTDRLAAKYGVKVSRKSLFQIDSFKENADIKLPDKMMDDIRIIHDLLRKISPMTQNMRLNHFVKRFESRYETMPVRLVEALDPDTGIGYEADGFPNTGPILASMMQQRRSTANGTTALSLSPLDHMLMSRIKAMPHGINEITLTADDIASLPTRSPQEMEGSFSAMFRLVQYDGKSIIDTPHFSGSSAANLLTRFAYAHDGINALCHEIAAEEQHQHPGKIIAEIAHLSSPRIGNIAYRPDFRSHTIDFLSTTGSHDGVIPLNDLWLKIDGGRLLMYSKRLRKEVLPRLTNAHNYSNQTSGIYKFLCDMQYATASRSLFFSWGSLVSIYPDLPRLSLGNAVLARARWTLDVKKINDSVDTFQAICRHKRMPRYLTYAEGDNCLFVDTESEISIRALFSTIKKRQSVVLEEFFPCEYSGGHIDISECIIPFTQTTH